MLQDAGGSFGSARLYHRWGLPRWKATSGSQEHMDDLKFCPDTCSLMELPKADLTAFGY